MTWNQESQRLIGRSLRAVTGLVRLGERTIWIYSVSRSRNPDFRSASDFVAAVSVGIGLVTGRATNATCADWQFCQFFRR